MAFLIINISVLMKTVGLISLCTTEFDTISRERAVPLITLPQLYFYKVVHLVMIDEIVIFKQRRITRSS